MAQEPAGGRLVHFVPRAAASDEDTSFMRRALRLACRGVGRTSPNPAVGAVVVAGGRVVGEGYHRRAGEPHAEPLALAQAGEQARGATLYVTLEPCCHHGRTPPCTEAILAAGIRRVVAATVDPNPRVAGKGLARLEQAGVRVEVGLLREEAEALNEPYLTYIRTGRPFLHLKLAVSLDGKVATETGDSRWISGPAARRLTHRWRARYDAVLVGVGTVLADDPLLTVRMGVRGRHPIRIVADSLARTPPGARLFTAGLGGEGGPVWIATTPAAPPARLEALRQAGAEVILCPAGRDDRVDLAWLMEELGRRGITGVLAEGGPRLAGAALRGQLVHRLSLFVAPLLIGGDRAPGVLAGAGVSRVAEGWRLDRLRVRRVGQDWLFDGYPVRPTLATAVEGPAPAAGEAKEGVSGVHGNRSRNG